MQGFKTGLAPVPPPAGYWHSGTSGQVHLTSQPDLFVVPVRSIAVPTEKGELVQSGNRRAEVESTEVGLRSLAPTRKAAAWVACSR